MAGRPDRAQLQVLDKENSPLSVHELNAKVMEKIGFGGSIASSLRQAPSLTVWRVSGSPGVALSLTLRAARNEVENGASGMDILQREQGTYRFSRSSVDPSLRALFIDGEPVKLAERLFDVLVCLVINHGRVAERNELPPSPWAGRTVEDNTVGQARATS